MNLHPRLPTCFLLLACAACLWAQPNPSAFVKYTSDQGLSHDMVNDMVKDQQGFLWVATSDGLNRFDGHSFRQFFHDPNGKPGESLPDNFIKYLSLSPGGDIFISTNKGVCRLQPTSLKFSSFHLPEPMDSLEDNIFGKVVFDRQGSGWVSGKTALHHFDPASGKVLASYPIEHRHAGYECTYLDDAGRLWLVHIDKINYFDTRSKKLRHFVTYNPGNPLAGAGILQVRQDQRGTIWIGTWSKGLLKYDPATDSLLDVPDKNSLARLILPDAASAGHPFLWIAGGKHGLYVYYPETDEDFQFEPDRSDPWTHNHYLPTALFKDETSGSVWIGTEVGLEHYAPMGIRFGRVLLPKKHGMGQFSLMSSAVRDATDPGGDTYFIGMWGSGVVKWNRRLNKKEHFHQGNSGAHNGVFCMMQDRQGYVWTGVYDAVVRYDPRTGKWRTWRVWENGEVSRNAYLCCIEDRQGGLWFGSNWRGLYHFNPATDRLEKVPLPPEAYSPNGRLYVHAMSLDRNGKIWLATRHRPLLFDPRTRQVQIFDVKSEKASHNTWESVVAAASGKLYVCSQASLLELDSACNVSRIFTTENGLRSRYPVRVTEDHLGRIWLSSTRFLHCLDPKTGKFNYYGTADGLFKNTMTDGLVGLPNGEIFVGFQDAFNYFDPARLRRNATPPPVVFTGFRVMNKERQPTVRHQFTLGGGSKTKQYERDTALVLAPGETVFTIQFAALNFIQPERNRYAYRLEGFSEEWTETDLNFATFTNLDGGAYLFHVKAANNDGVWNETGAKIWVKVNPPLTKTWQFKASMLVLAGLIFLAIWGYRREQRRRLEAFRQSLARDLHDEMGSTLSSIRFFSEFARQQVGEEKPQVAPVLQRISESASSLSESMQDIVWAMKTKNDRLEDLGARMTEFGLRLLEARGVAFKTSMDADFSSKHLPPELRRNVWLIFKEAVNNAAKYAEATEVELTLHLRRGWLLLKLSDNGKGFSMNGSDGVGGSPLGVGGAGGGNGLQNMRQRAGEIGGRLAVFSAPGRGTKVELKVKV